VLSIPVEKPAKIFVAAPVVAASAIFLIGLSTVQY